MAPGAGGVLGAPGTRFAFGASQAGESLVEIAATIAILGLALAALVTAIGSTTRMSGVAAQTARAESEARRVAESLRAAPDNPSCLPAVNPTAIVVNKAYYACLITYRPELWSTPTDLTRTIASVQCGRFVGAPPQPQYDITDDGCNGSPPDFHRVKVTVTSANGGPSASVTFVKRRPSS